jgi:hypothetical protein
MAHPTELDRLTRKCTDSLAYYIEEAKRTCKLLNAITRHPVSEDERKELSIQRSRENRAYIEYHEVRERLFEIAEWKTSTAE